mgnify:CR=1 FL=1
MRSFPDASISLYLALNGGPSARNLHEISGAKHDGPGPIDGSHPAIPCVAGPRANPQTLDATVPGSKGRAFIRSPASRADRLAEPPEETSGLYARSEGMDQPGYYAVPLTAMAIAPSAVASTPPSLRIDVPLSNVRARAFAGSLDGPVLASIECIAGRSCALDLGEVEGPFALVELAPNIRDPDTFLGSGLEVD